MVVGADKDYSIMPNGVIKAEILLLRQYFTMHPCWWSYNSELCKPWQLKKVLIDVIRSINDIFEWWGMIEPEIGLLMYGLCLCKFTPLYSAEALGKY